MSVAGPGWEIFDRLSGRTGLPTTAHLQISDRCNHKCLHCYQVQGEKGEMSLADIRSILDDLASAGVLVLDISGGEATLRHDLPEILRDARSRNFAVRLFTNAYAVDDALADAIAVNGVMEVHVSLYSDRDAEHDAVTQVPGSLKRTLAGIRRLREREVRVVIKTPLTTLAPGARERVQALAEDLGCSQSSSPTLTPAEDGSLAPLDLQPTPEQLAADHALDPWLPPEDLESARQQKLEAAACGLCGSSVAIMPNGEVRPCSDTIVPLGNLTRKPLGEIMKSEEVRLFRDLRWRDVHGCRDCDLLLACTRCHATAAQQGGDYLGPYASACTLARGRYAAGVGAPIRLLGNDRSHAPAPIGPYRIVSPGVLRVIDDTESPLDAARADRFPWIRPSKAYVASRVSADSGIVSLRKSRHGARIAPAAVRPPCTDFSE